METVKTRLVSKSGGRLFSSQPCVWRQQKWSIWLIFSKISMFLSVYLSFLYPECPGNSSSSILETNNLACWTCHQEYNSSSDNAAMSSFVKLHCVSFSSAIALLLYWRNVVKTYQHFSMNLQLQSFNYSKRPWPSLYPVVPRADYNVATLCLLPPPFTQQLPL